MQGDKKLENVAVVLVRPRFPENIGSVARAMKNMGLGRLIIVNGVSPLEMAAYQLASGAGDILERAEEATSISEAVRHMGCVVGMTSRPGRGRNPLLTPEALVQIALPLLTENTIGLVFGPEKDGLTNEELSLCHHLVRIPAVSSFPSLNLAQAVMIICYELFKARAPIPGSSYPLASAQDLENMFQHMERTLLRIGFFHGNRPGQIMGTLRRIFGRSGMSDREVRILQGIWSQVDRLLVEREGAEGPPSRCDREGG